MHKENIWRLDTVIWNAALPSCCYEMTVAPQGSLLIVLNFALHSMWKGRVSYKC